MQERTYISVPGERTHELPPLLIHGEGGANISSPEKIVEQAQGTIEAEDLVPSMLTNAGVIAQHKYDLSIQLAQSYLGIVAHWQWGDSILEWIRQCEITFAAEETLRKLLHADLWPHAGRSSFVTLLEDKAVPSHGVVLKKAVGLRLTFRQPPPIDFFSDQFLFYLNTHVADSAYYTWSHMTAATQVLFPPERFHFQVHELGK